MNHRWILYIFLVWFIYYVYGLNTKAGPFDVVLLGGERCPGYEKDECQYTYKLKKVNRTSWAIDVDAWLTSSLSDNDKLTLILDQKANNQWKENFFRKDFELICTIMELFVPEHAARVFEALRIKGCPIKPGNYSAKNFPVSFNIKAVPMFFYNSYRVRASVYSKEGRRKFCAMAYIDVVPKRRTKG